MIEAVRGKRGSIVGEAADVLLVLMSITQNSEIPFDAVLTRAWATVSELRIKPHYAGEEYTITDAITEKKCGICGHKNGVGEHGVCKARNCFCECVFAIAEEDKN